MEIVMTVEFTWHPEPALLTEVLQLAQHQGRSPEAIVTEAVQFYLQHSSNPEISDLTNQPLSLSERLAFMKLSLDERRQILQQQADAMSIHYEQDSEWREWQTGDLIEY
jgi:hypothetical protein